MKRFLYGKVKSIFSVNNFILQNFILVCKHLYSTLFPIESLWFIKDFHIFYLYSKWHVFLSSSLVDLLLVVQFSSFHWNFKIIRLFEHLLCLLYRSVLLQLVFHIYHKHIARTKKCFHYFLHSHSAQQCLFLAGLQMCMHISNIFESRSKMFIANNSHIRRNVLKTKYIIIISLLF